MVGDLSVIFFWWSTWLILGLIGWIAARKIFSTWDDEGYFFGKIIGAGTITFLMWIAGSLKLLSFGVVSLNAILVGVILLELIWIKNEGEKQIFGKWKLIVAEELVFLGALIFWSWIKAHEPTINGLEKFMDYGFVKSIMQGSYFPPKDMWFAGETINYYYFGHLMLAVVTKFSGVSLPYTFNLMLATIFAFCLTMSASIAGYLLKEMPKRIKAGGMVLTAFLVSLSGNLHTIYIFTKGYVGEYPPLFWKIWSDFSSWRSITSGIFNYWYPNATRFIPWTIHEFPSYSFTVSDVHGHVLSIPLALTALAMLVNMFWNKRIVRWYEYATYGFLSGLLFMTNAMDGPIYLGLFGLILIVKKPGSILKILGVTGLSFGATILLFLSNFKSFVTGVAVNCPPAFLAERKIGPLLFETVDKCQKSPMWMLFILWGFFIYCGIKLWRTKSNNLLLIWCVFCLGLIIFPEFFYFKDIYPDHFRSNTMFKLGYQAFMMMSIMAGYVIIRALAGVRKNKLFLLGLAPLLFLVSIYPLFAVRSYFGGLKHYQGLYGLKWLTERYPGDAAAIAWLLSRNPPGSQPVILEASGDSYTDFNRISVFSGLPTVAGWTVHEWLWRGGYGPISNRAEEVSKVYESTQADDAKEILDKYQVKYVIVGGMEREKYPLLREKSIASLGKLVFSEQGTEIYEVSNILSLPKTTKKEVLQITKHVVVRGDNLWNISKYYCGFGSNWPKISLKNKISNPQIISVGTELIIDCE